MADVPPGGGKATRGGTAPSAGVAVVTGAASGIGRAVAIGLAETGHVIAALDRDSSGAEETARAVSEAGGRAIAYAVDVSTWPTVQATIRMIEAELGPIGVLVNSAGILRMGTVADMALEDWSATFRVNVDGVFHACRAVLPGMLTREAGCIVNVASWFGKIGKPHFSAYCASKFAVIGLTQSLAMEVAAKRINVNAVCPGTIVGTRMRTVADDGARRLGLPTAKEREATIPLGRAGEPEDVARVVRFLVSADARYMTGQAINVTGGLWMS